MFDLLSLVKMASSANRAIALSQAVPFSRRLPITKEIQRNLNLGDTHVVWVGPESFAVAHTDEERSADGDLEECELHKWLVSQDDQPYDTGYYRVAPADPWEFEVIEIANGEAW